MTWWGTTGAVLFLAAAAATLAKQMRMGIECQRLSTAGAAVLAFLPIADTTIAGVFLGVVGPISAATVVLCALRLYATFSRKERARAPSRALLLCLLATGIVFYLMTFGLTDFDPYDLGYRGATLPILMFAFLVVGWLVQAADIACWIGLAAALYLVDANQSSNMWDYLIFPLDPLIAAFALLGSRRQARGSNPAGSVHG